MSALISLSDECLGVFVLFPRHAFAQAGPQSAPDLTVATINGKARFHQEFHWS